jgi:hypothetical protein
MLRPQPHSVLDLRKTGLAAADALDVDQAIKAMANHAIGKPTGSADRCGAEMRYTRTQKAGSNRFAETRLNWRSVEKDSDGRPNESDWTEHAGTS